MYSLIQDEAKLQTCWGKSTIWQGIYGRKGTPINLLLYYKIAYSCLFSGKKPRTTNRTIEMDSTNITLFYVSERFSGRGNPTFLKPLVVTEIKCKNPGPKIGILRYIEAMDLKI